MKKLFLILAMLPMVLFAQKVERKSTKQILELKDCVANYCLINMNIAMSMSASLINADIEVDETETLRFVEPSGEKKKFKTVTEILNYMYVNGWEYKRTIGEGLTGLDNKYLFEKRK